LLASLSETTEASVNSENSEISQVPSAEVEGGLLRRVLEKKSRNGLEALRKYKSHWGKIRWCGLNRSSTGL